MWKNSWDSFLDSYLQIHAFENICDGLRHLVGTEIISGQSVINIISVFLIHICFDSFTFFTEELKNSNIQKQHQPHWILF